MVRGKPQLELLGFYGVQANLNLFQLDTTTVGWPIIFIDHTLNIFKNLKNHPWFFSGVNMKLSEINSLLTSMSSP